MSREKLNAAARHFFERILPAATKKRLSELANAEVLVGAYRRHAGGPVQSFGNPITAQFMLKIAPGAVPIQNGLPTLGEAQVGEGALDQPLVWMRFAADPKLDDKAAIQDLMGDLDTYAQRKFSLAGVNVELTDETPAPPNSAQWAETIQANRASLPDNITTLTEVPASFKSVASSIDAFRLILSHFFTYDSSGAYYPKWTGAGRQIPQDLSEPYKQNNVREMKLERDQLYVYLLTPKRLFTDQAAEPHDYREAVIRLDESGDPSNPFLPTLVHSVYKRLEAKAPVHDFVFFESEDGLGLPVPAEVRAKVSPSVTQFLISIPENPADRTAFFAESTHVVEGNPPLVHLLATTSASETASIQLPQGVLSHAPESGGVLSILSPVDKILEIAALPAVTYLDLSGRPSTPHMNLVRPAIDFDTFRAKFKSKQDGEGVIVGVIDSGIDGSHAMFKDGSGNTRILAVWEQNDGVALNANSPAAKHPGNAAYALFNYGRERTGADVSGATDQATGHGAGHGTHVTGTAAGAEVTSATGNVPRGIASKANIIVVKAIGQNQGNTDHGLQYIFQKAKELSMPCVVNMSFGHHDHAHDGTDDTARLLTRQLRDSSGAYLKGRVLVASAGNDRGSPIHVRRDVANGNSTTIRVTVNKLISNPVNFLRFGLVTTWIRPSSPADPKPNLRVTIQHVATGWSSSAITPTSANTVVSVPGQNTSVQISYGNKDPQNGDYNLRATIFRASGTAGLPQQEWRIIIANLSATIELHAWAVLSSGFEGLVVADNSYKVGTPGAARDTISVACSVTRLAWPDIDPPNPSRNFGQTRLGDIATFSSPGPLRTCSDRLLSLFGLTLNLTHPAIDIAAPGSATQSALATSVPTIPASNNRWKMANNVSWFMQGTSMAAPVITGLVACMLAEEKDLTQDDVRTRIRAAGKLPAGTATVFDPGSPDKDDWGEGLINSPSLKP